MRRASPAEPAATETRRAGPPWWPVLRVLRGNGGWLLPATVVVILVGAVVPLLFKVASGVLIGTAPAVFSRGGHGRDMHVALVALVAAGVLLGVGYVIATVQLALSEVLGRRLANQLRDRLMRAVLRPKQIAHLEDTALRDKIAVAQGVSAGFQGPAGGVLGLVGATSGQLTGLGSAATLAVIRPAVGLGALAVHLVIGWRLRRRFRHAISAMYVQPGVLREADYYRDLLLTPGAEKEIRVFGLSSWITQRQHGHWVGVMQAVWEERREARAALAAAAAALVVTYGLGFSVLATAAEHGRLSLAGLAIGTQALLAMLPLAAISEWDTQMQVGGEAVLALEAIEQAVGTAPEPARSAPASGRAAVSDIRFDGVSFRYPGTDHDVICGLDLAIPMGQSCALVGRNGAGKSTILKLLLDLYTPDGGCILVDGRPLQVDDAAAWRREVSVVMQDSVRYALSARDNVGFGCPGRAHDQAALDEAAAVAGALDIIEGLPFGWDTVLSPQFARGTDLSAGQWQRIAIARGVFGLLSGAKILILDEPTANLDIPAEREIYEQIVDACHGRTLILVSHRFATVRKADRIFVIDEGRVIEVGGHDELIGLDGVYATMYNAQASLTR